MHLLAFEPITGAIGLFLLENTCRTKPHRYLPRARMMFKRFEDIFMDAVVNEAAEPLLDRVVNAVDLKMVLLLAALLVFRRIAARRVIRLPRTRE
jgi:hypothetical protein